MGTPHSSAGEHRLKRALNVTLFIEQEECHDAGKSAKKLCLFYKESEVSRCAVIKRLKEGLHGKMDSGTLGKPFRGS